MISLGDACKVIYEEAYKRLQDLEGQYIRIENSEADKNENA